MDESAVAPVLGVVLLVALTVLVAATAAVLVAGGVGELERGGTVASARGHVEVDPVDPDVQRVTLRYVAGPPLALDQLALAVELPNGRSGRIVDLPAGRGGRCYGDPDDVILPGNVAGDPIFSRACGDAEGAITAKGGRSDVWRPGESATFRVKVAAGGGADLAAGDELRVAVVDVDTGAVVAVATGTVG